MQTCHACGFDAADYTPLDLLGTLRALAPIWRTMTEGVDESVLATRPVPDAWSAIEHAAYTRDVIRGNVMAGAESEASPSLAAVITEIDKAVARVQAAATRGAADPAPSVDVVHAVHEGTHHVRAAGRGLHALGAGAPSTRGTLAQVSSSQGGVPKAALASAVVDHRGIVGDRQAERRHHGKPLQALSLWSQEVIDALRSEGHPVYAGAAGENLTVRGLDWAAIRPGVRIAVGNALIEISAFATPCAKNAQWFTDGNFRRIDHNLRPGWSRAYAWVVEGGTVAPGDVIVVEPTNPSHP